MSGFVDERMWQRNWSHADFPDSLNSVHVFIPLFIPLPPFRKRQRRGEPITGQWARAQKYVRDYVAYGYALQNEDGSFSTRWFEGRGNADDIDRQRETNGHTLEWLLLSVPDDQLSDPRLVRAVEFLTDLMWQHCDHDWPIGPKGHAIHALVLYDERVFGGKPGQRRQPSAA